ncbi:DUF5067 domain-containing protein [Blautia hydrogenotrophica]|uniref:DUF5067 domain-containing protein n=1 Tax=Blautia hydrogenotrophica TaxID=53443 RepID=UPI00294222D4|nr:DUF5067 domain-containing protein [Blautia hydrogenotrophica]
MKKKFLSALFIITLSISLTACGGNNNESTTTKQEENTAQEESKENSQNEVDAETSDVQVKEEAPQEEETSSNELTYEAEGHTYKYVKNQITQNSEGQDCVAIFFDYTNNSGENASPSYALTIKAFQNGMELTGFMPADDSIPEANNAFKEIQSGYGATIAMLFQINDMSDISVEIGPMVRYNDTEIGEFTIPIEQ